MVSEHSPPLYKQLHLKQLAGYLLRCPGVNLFACRACHAQSKFVMKISEFAIQMSRSSNLVSSLFTRATAAVMLACLLGATLSTAAQAAPPNRHTQSHCRNCGTVISTHTYQKPASKGSGVGIASGAVIGGLLGNQIGHGNGRALATVAGAVGGGYAGNVVEKRMNSTTVTQVRVRMADGSVRTFSEAGNSRWHSGQGVKVINGALTARG
jgi:outer membrane lipoprotein SlyB